MLVFFAGRYDKIWLWSPAALILCGALPLTALALALQFVGLKEKCALCVAVAAIVFIGSVPFFLVRRSG
jgi:hypothetical protein